MKMTQNLLTPVVLGLLLGMSGPANAQYRFTTYDVPGSSRTAVNGNSPHAIAGEFDDADGTHGFVLSNGAFTEIDVPDAAGVTSVNGINAKGELAGTYVDAVGTTHGYFRSKKGVVTTLTPPGATRTQAGFLNARGEVVGTYRDANPLPQTRHGFIWRKGVFTTFDVTGSEPPLGTVAFGINDAGEVVGNYVTDDGVRHGFVGSDGVYTTLDPPGAILTIAEGINNSGKIVGLYLDADSNQHGFGLSTKGVYTTIDVPGSVATGVFSINAQGQIVGSYDDAVGVTHGFVGTPTH
jgi:probable HAF family extracellular repeat protein